MKAEGAIIGRLDVMGQVEHIGGALDNGAMNQTGGDVVKVRVPFIISRAIYMNPKELR